MTVHSFHCCLTWAKLKNNRAECGGKTWRRDNNYSPDEKKTDRRINSRRFFFFFGTEMVSDVQVRARQKGQRKKKVWVRGKTRLQTECSFELLSILIYNLLGFWVPDCSGLWNNMSEETVRFRSGQSGKVWASVDVLKEPAMTWTCGSVRKLCHRSFDSRCRSIRHAGG